MPPAWSTVLELAGFGSLQLFGYLAGLVALMYALTSPVFYGRTGADTGAETGSESPELDRGAVEPAEDAVAEADRRQRAVVLAVAVACASISRPPARADGLSGWRQLQRARRLTQPVRRQRSRR